MLALALVALVAEPITEAAAAPLGCGSVITASVTLSADIGPCNQGGLVVRGNGITVNLGGHTVLGKARIGDGAGILLDHTTGSTVTNGTVRSFDAGVEVLGGGSNTVSNLTARNNVGGDKSDPNLGDGITIQFSNSNTVSGNVVFQNGPFSGISIVNDASTPAVGSDANVITGNRVTGNSYTVPNVPVNQDDGIRIEGPNATNTVISNNTVQGNGLDGISVFADQGTGHPNTGTVISGNNIAGNGFHQEAHRKGNGIVLFGAPGSTTVRGADGSMVQNNTVQGNAANGIQVASLSNTITGNTATGNDAFPGVTAWDLTDLNTNPPCGNNAWSGNTFGTTNNPGCIS